MTYVKFSLEAARAEVERYRLEWENAKAQLAAMVSSAAIEKTRLPDNYWLEERRARAKYEAARQLLEMLTPEETT